MMADADYSQILASISKTLDAIQQALLSPAVDNDLQQLNRLISELVQAGGTGSSGGSTDLVDEITRGVDDASGVTSTTTPVSWPSALSTASAVIVGQNTTNRAGLLFHNPGTVNLYICPGTNNSGGSLPASIAGAGTYLLAPGASLPITGLCSNSWNGIAASGTGNPITVLEFLR